jgi:hypothetical protein
MFHANVIIKIAGLFYTSVTEHRNCELRLKTANLDHEKKSEYQLQIKLDTLSGLVSPSRSIAMVSMPCYWSVNSEVMEPNENYCVLCVLYTNTLTTSSNLAASFCCTALGYFFP